MSQAVPRGNGSSFDIELGTEVTVNLGNTTLTGEVVSRSTPGSGLRYLGMEDEYGYEFEVSGRRVEWVDDDGTRITMAESVQDITVHD